MSVKTRNPLVGDRLYVSQKEFYRKTYIEETAPPWEKSFDQGWLGATLEKLGPGQGKLALDIGAGSGRASIIMARRGYKVVGVDYVFHPLPSALARARNRPWPKFINTDLFEAPFRQGSFDMALDWGVFHHIRRRDTAGYISAVTALLKPGGVFLLGCFSRNFRHEGEGNRKRNWTVHRGHYDRFSSAGELRAIFAPYFIMGRVWESPSGFYYLSMRKAG
ncbi:MAG: class I SAM-dependent methyltransferase [Nitrospinae bacterium]|nr:class I SAM-dependent methyltransferase [Nitrospinota bacterium]